ncbi:MAG: helix-turn-helix domain-containing protein [Hahellaceae bacterium]|nr:helix-turn-helix domain-containing protein [Hahellaceae bacterium]
MTTIEAREQLDVMQPAPRIFELRKMGLKILTIWTTSINAQGKKHRNARYVLMSKGGAA